MQKKKMAVCSDIEKYLSDNFEAFSKKENGYYVVYTTKPRGKTKYSGKNRYCGVFSEQEGKLIIPCEHSHVIIKDNGIVVMDIQYNIKKFPRNVFGYYDLEGNCVAPCKYQMVKRVGNLLITNTFENRQGLIDILNSKVLCPDYAPAIRQISKHLVLVVDCNMKFLFVAENAEPVSFQIRNGREFIKTRHFDKWEFAGKNKEHLILKNGKRCAVIDSISGEQILPCIYDSIIEQEHHFRVMESGWHGLLNKTDGREIVPCRQDRIYETKYFYITQKGKKVGAYLKNGQLVIDNIVDEINVGKDGIEACIKKGDNLVCGFFDNNGNNVFPIKYSPYEIAQEYQKRGIAHCQSEYDDVCLFGEYLVTQKNGKEGALDARTRKTILQCEYDEILVCDEGFFVRQNEGWGFFTNKGKKIYDCKYDICELYKCFMGGNLISQPQRN